MIIQKTLEVTIVPININYWRDKGYDCHIGTISNRQKIIVKISELASGSNVKVSCHCDECNTEYVQRYSRNTDVCGSCRSSKRMIGNVLGKKSGDGPSKDELISLHFDKKMGPQKLSKHYDVSIPVIKRWFKMHDIKYKDYTKRYDTPSREELEQKHIVEKNTIEDLVDHYSSSPTMIKRWLTHYGIDRKYHRKKRKLSVTELAEMEDMHHNKKMSMADIAKRFNVSDVIIGLWFKEYNIEKKYHNSGKSKAEKELIDFLNNNTPHTFTKDRTLLSGIELDMVCKKTKLAIEYCGLYWHSETQKGKYYHENKQQMCNDIGYQLLTIFEHEWLYSKDIVKSIILSKLGVYDEILYARECKMVELEKHECKKFLDENHLQGSSTGLINCFGLINKENELVGCISYGKHHRNPLTNTIVLNRLCFKKNVCVVGGASRLFKHSRKFIDNKKVIISWSDNRWSDGSIYKVLGFSQNKKSLLPPDYMYFKSQKIFPKQSMTKLKLGCPKEITEYNFCKSLGFDRIWDCGKIRWEYKGS